MSDQLWWLQFRRECLTDIKKYLRTYQMTGDEWFRGEAKRLGELSEFAKEKLSTG